jgi:membrane associated rhomboid family serine protease
MLIPYRAKNPPDHFPYATITLMAINIAVYLVTSEMLLSIRDDMVKQFAVSHATLSPLRLFTSMFLHADLFHLAGNMLFLWLFGASVEGRIRPWKFVPLYLVAGLVGGILHDLIIGVISPGRFALGASGAVMGVAGAYLWIFPYSTIVVAWQYWWRFGVSEWEARWLVLLYVLLDLLQGFFFREFSGVGNFAHLGGFAGGLLGAVALRPRRDTEDVSTVQAMHADLKDYSLLSYPELATLMEGGSQDPKLVVAFVDKAIKTADDRAIQAAIEALNRHGRTLIEEADPGHLAGLLLGLRDSGRRLPPAFFLRLAGRLETAHANETAGHLYRRLYDLNPQAPAAEIALLRLARLLERAWGDRAQAGACYQEMLRLFPHGENSLEARRSLQRLQSAA